MIIRTALVAALVSALAAPAMADTKTAQFDVKLNVKKACSISASDLDFGSHDFSESANIDATSTITVKCTKGTSYTVGLNAGSTSGNTDTARKMAGITSGNTDTVAYALYSNSGRTTNWGATVGMPTAATGNNNNQTLTVYGRVLPGALNVQADDYKDTITATITY